ncbi:MAG: U32 family peptidase [bacterium]
MSELLAPAGTLEKLKWAAVYGADAVYFGLSDFSLRSYAGNFSLKDASEGIEFLHKKDKKAFATLNIYPFSDEYKDIVNIAGNLCDMGIDAVIISDLGVFNEIKKSGLPLRIHISTQANTMSHQTVRAYFEMGAKRVNLARELSLEQIKEIQKELTDIPVETEVFIHGAVCFSYSGRCAISDYLTGRRANRGECTHPCRWQYSLVEETRPGKFFPVAEDKRGLYFFNSSDLALFSFIKPLMKAEVDSFKIEGRMKSIHYLASTVSLYRRLINGEDIPENEVLTLLNRVKNRGYSTGFMKSKIDGSDYNITGSTSSGTSEFLGNAISSENGETIIEVRNKIHSGIEVEVLKPDGSLTSMMLPETLTLHTGESVKTARHQQFIKIEHEIPTFSIIRELNK